ncbi:MAG: prolipoprotein diacylglyceryl transferase [Bacteriovoracaceae bacterium]
MNQDWIDPVIFSLGPLQVRWYGAMYVIGFLLGGFILKKLADRKFWPLSQEHIDQYITWLIIGMFFGARLAYVFVYNWEYYSVNFLEIFSVWKGGLSFHGAVAGMCLSTYLFAKKNGVRFLQLTDCMAIAGTPGLFFGRMGNFINGELYGRVTDSWVGIVFPGGGPFPRHPSQLYEGILEGICLWIVLILILRRQRFYGVVSAIFCLGYGAFRFIVEFFREPDTQLGYFFGFFTMGQLLCLLMIPLSVYILMYAKKMNLKNPLLKS